MAPNLGIRLDIKKTGTSTWLLTRLGGLRIALHLDKQRRKPTPVRYDITSPVSTEDTMIVRAYITTWTL